MVIGSSVIDEEPKTPEEQLKSLPTQDEILQLPPFDLNEMPDIVTALKDSQPPDTVIIPVLDADNQILPEVLSELKVRGPRTVRTTNLCDIFLVNQRSKNMQSVISACGSLKRLITLYQLSKNH